MVLIDEPTAHRPEPDHVEHIQNAPSVVQRERGPGDRHAEVIEKEPNATRKGTQRFFPLLLDWRGRVGRSVPTAPARALPNLSDGWRPRPGALRTARPTFTVFCEPRFDSIREHDRVV